MKMLQKTLMGPPFKVEEEHMPSSAVDSGNTSPVTRPTAFKRNHGVTMGGVKLIYDPTLYLAFGLERDPREKDPAFVAWLTGQSDTYVPAFGPVARPEPAAVSFNASMNQGRGQQDDSQKSSTIETGDRGMERGRQLNTTALQADLCREQLATIIPRNWFGQRVDPPIDFDKELRTKMQKERWCSNYHLKANCLVVDCRFRHGVLDDKGKKALLSLTRGNVCRNRNGCNETDCYAGHQCPYDPCNKEQNCHFPREMHITDKQIVNIEVSLTPASCRRRSEEEGRYREGKG